MLATVKYPSQVHINDLLPLFFGHFRNRAIANNGRIVHKKIQTTKTIADCPHHPNDFISMGHICDYH